MFLLVQEHCFYQLEAPIERVSGWDTPYPHAQEWAYLPGPPLSRLPPAPAACLTALQGGAILKAQTLEPRPDSQKTALPDSRSHKRRIPHFTVVEEVDVSGLAALRAQLNMKWGAQRGHLTLLPFLIPAIVLGVREFPLVNAHFDDEAGVLTRHDVVRRGTRRHRDADRRRPHGAGAARRAGAEPVGQRGGQRSHGRRDPNNLPCFFCHPLSAEKPMTMVADILKSKADPGVHTIGSAASVFDAVGLMAQKSIGALVVVEHGQIAGMLTERDCATAHARSR